jgi:hypothetical protein
MVSSASRVDGRGLADPIWTPGVGRKASLVLL